VFDVPKEGNAKSQKQGEKDSNILTILPKGMFMIFFEITGAYVQYD
jgi:hypothetical protein